MPATPRSSRTAGPRSAAPSSRRARRHRRDRRQGPRAGSAVRATEQFPFDDRAVAARRWRSGPPRVIPLRSTRSRALCLGGSTRAVGRRGDGRRRSTRAASTARRPLRRGVGPGSRAFVAPRAVARGAAGGARARRAHAALAALGAAVRDRQLGRASSRSPAPPGRPRPRTSWPRCAARTRARRRRGRAQQRDRAAVHARPGSSRTRRSSSARWACAGSARSPSSARSRSRTSA